MNQTELKSILNYDQLTGIFTWIISRGSIKSGDMAGSLHPRGYHVIKINKKQYKGHRLAWLYVHGNLPSGEIDHKNRNKSDNRIDNLREASRSENCQNKTMLISNTSGVHGVSFIPRTQKYVAYITLDKVRHHLGTFDTIDLAKSARIEAEQKYHPFRP